MSHAEQLEPGAHAAGSTDDPERLRAEIARTRDDLGATVEALAAKADVGARARAEATEAANAMRVRVEHGRRTVEARTAAARDRAVDAVPQRVRAPVNRCVRAASDKRALITVGVVGLGALAAVLTWRAKRSAR